MCRPIVIQPKHERLLQKCTVYTKMEAMFSSTDYIVCHLSKVQVHFQFYDDPLQFILISIVFLMCAVYLVLLKFVFLNLLITTKGEGV